MAIEEPDYRVLENAEPFELREYQPIIVAETWVSGTMNKASNAGFRLIADYIFGNNTTSAGGSEKISMTAPVAMAPSSKKIDMTTPVSMAKDGEQWRIHFVMPSEYTIETLPKPNNPKVTLRKVSSKRYAVHQFSWLAGAEKVAKKTAELQKWLQEKGIEPKGEPILARYNPPWTLPFLRRNEVMLEY